MFWKQVIDNRGRNASSMVLSDLRDLASRSAQNESDRRSTEKADGVVRSYGQKTCQQPPQMSEDWRATAIMNSAEIAEGKAFKSKNHAGGMIERRL